MPVLLDAYMRTLEPSYWVLVRGFNLSYHNGETIVFIIDPYYGNLSSRTQLSSTRHSNEDSWTRRRRWRKRTALSSPRPDLHESPNLPLKEGNIYFKL